MCRKAQISVEFLSYYIMLTIIFMAVIGLIISNMNIVEKERLGMDAKRVLITAKNEIDIAIGVGDGYSRQFSLPQVLYSGSNYTIDISPDFQLIYVYYENKNISLPILTDNITATIKKGTNIIKNTNGMISFE
jgi:hypothetical protein